MISDLNADIAYIATPYAFNEEQALLCLQHVKPVLCEKPMTLTYRQTSHLTDVATKQNLFLMEAMWTGCTPFINGIKEIIAEGTIGKVRHVQADFGFASPFDADSRLYNYALGGGSVMDIGIYPLFLATLLLGKSQNIQVAATLSPTQVDEMPLFSFNMAMEVPHS